MLKHKILYKVVLIFVATAFAFQSCVDIPTEVKIPNWDVELNLPLTEDTFVLDSILDLEENIEIVEEGDVRIYAIKSEDYEEEFETSQFLEGKLNGSFTGYSFPIATADTLIGIPLPSGALIDTAHLKRGQIQFNINNTSDKTVDLQLVFTGLLRESNGQFDSYAFSYSLDPGENLQNQNINLSDFRYTTRAQVNKDELQLHILMNADPTLDPIELSFNMVNTDFYYIKGTIPTLTLDPVRQGVELPLTDDAREARDQLYFKDATMKLRAEYSGPIPAQDVFTVVFQNVQLTGVRDDGSTFEMTNQNGDVNLNDITVRNGVYEYEFNADNSNIDDFLSFIPDSIIISGDIVMNPDAEQGAASDQDKVKITINVESKARVVIDSDPYVTEEPLEIDNDIYEEFDNIKSATLFYELINGIPLDVDIDLEFQTENGDSLFAKSVSVNRAVMTDETTARKTITEDQLDLNTEEIQVLDQAKIIQITWTPNTRQEPPYPYFGPDMEVAFKSWFTIVYHIDPEAE